MDPSIIVKFVALLAAAAIVLSMVYGFFQGLTGNSTHGDDGGRDSPGKAIADNIEDVAVKKEKKKEQKDRKTR